MRTGTSPDIDLLLTSSRKNSARISQAALISLHDFKINPLTRHAVLLVCQRVVDDDLKDVFARRQISTELDHAAGQQPFQIRRVGDLERILLAGEHRFAVSKQTDLRGQLRGIRRLVEVSVVNYEAVGHQHAASKMSHCGTGFGIALFEAFLTLAWCRVYRLVRAGLSSGP